jgi:large repetitive protein
MLRARNRLVLAAGLALLALAALSGAGAGQALAAKVSCGERIKKDTTLTSDLRNCRNNGLAIAADGITLDLNGHTIDGNGVLRPNCMKVCDAGVVIANHDGVRIRGAGDAVTQFGLGVLAYGTRNLRVDRVQANHNAFSGLVIVRSRGTKLRQVATLADGLHTDQSGMAFFDTHHLLLQDSRLNGNGDIGLYVERLQDSRLIGNVFKDNPESGVLLDGNRNLIAHNRFRRCGDGLGLSGNRNVIRGNHVHNSRRGCSSHGLGLQVEGGSLNVISRNRVRGTRSFGISVASYGALSRTKVRDNWVSGAGKDGIRVKRVLHSLSRTLLAGNHVTGSADDGIDVSSHSTKLRGNEADGNADFGIDSVAGVDDAANNSAQGNGDSRECRHVACG